MKEQRAKATLCKTRFGKPSLKICSSINQYQCCKLREKYRDAEVKNSQN